MPRIHVKKAQFFQLLGKQLTMEELVDLGFEYGIEIEEDDLDQTKVIFEIAANRHDLSCVEGLAEAIGVYLGLQKMPVYKNITQADTKQRIDVRPATQKIRPFVVAAILRNITFDQDRYDSFIDLQDKLHMNIGRKRTLISMGTHDLDTIKGPFVYDAQKPEDIKFIPLNQTQEMTGKTLMEFYQTDAKLKEFLPIIRDSDVYPVVLDATGRVLSLPPIINSDHSKIKLTTKNVFIECTATDLTKASIVLNIIVTMFSRYCTEPFTFEQVDVHYEHSGEKKVTPDVDPRKVEADVKYISDIVGVNIETDKVIELLKKMSLNSTNAGNNKIIVEVPPSRSDVLHPCDIAEDVATAYGINNIPFVYPSTSTTGSQLTLNKLTDLVRQEAAQAGYSECLNFALCSINEVTEFIDRSGPAPAPSADIKELMARKGLENAIFISNPKTAEFQVGRTTLLPGLLKSVASNKAQKLPLNLFEVGDIILRAENECGSKNERRLACLHTNENTSGFELIHGFLDYIMMKLNISANIEKKVGDTIIESSDNKKVKYTIRESSDKTFFEGMQAEVLLNGVSVGRMGILHPEVLTRFNWTYPTSYLELNLEKLIFDGYLKE